MPKGIPPAEDLEDRSRFAKLVMATNDVLNQAYRDILETEVPPSDIETKVKASSVYKRLHPEQEHTLQGAKHSGYEIFDISLTYTLIRNICKKIPKPTKGKWGDEPAAGEVTVGDDVERIRSIRNRLTHSSSVSQTEFDDTWSMMSDVCKRLETFTGKKYVDHLNHIQTITEDDVMETTEMKNIDVRSGEEDRWFSQYIDNIRQATIGEHIKSGTIQMKKKSEEETKGYQKIFCWPEETFNKKLEQLKESENYEFRVQRLSSLMNIETYNLCSNQRDHMENNDFKDIIKKVDYLDCSGLQFTDAEKQSKSFEPFSQSSVDDFLEWMTDFNKFFRKTQSPKCRLILSILFSVYAKKAMSEFKPLDLSLIINRCLECAIENQNHILISEIVRSYLLDFDFHLCKLFQGKKRFSLLMDTFLTTAKYRILRECPRLRQNAIRLSFCCECNKESRLVIMMIYKGSIEMKDGIPEEVMGVNLVLYNYTQPSDEASTVFNSFAASCLSQNMPVITEKEAKILFKNHSNLTLISVSPVKSTGYSKGRHTVFEKQCINLLCLHKGYIPFGEKEFPKQINGFDVDVQEGYCFLESGRSIDSGGHIRRCARGINTLGHGSIGGFVDLPNGSFGLITCAHVVLSSDELNRLRYEQKDKNKSYFFTGFEVETFDKNQHEFKVSGRIKDACYSKLADAALIELDQSVNEFRFRATPDDQLLTAGFDPNKPPVFNGQVVLDGDPVQGKISGTIGSVIKYGSATGFTIGSLYSNAVHARFVDKDITFYNLIEVHCLPHGPFSLPGDSGAFVFCINPDKTLDCIGMCKAGDSKTSSLLIPIARVLRSLGRSEIYRLKPCPFNIDRSASTASESSSSSQQTNIEAMLFNHLSNIQKSMESIQTEIRNLKTEVRETNAKLQTKVENLKRELQSESPGSTTQVNSPTSKLI